MTQDTPPHRPEKLTRNRALWRYLRGEGLLFLLGTIALAATNLLALRIPRQIGQAIDHLRQADSAVAIDVDVLQTSALTIAALAVGAALTRIGSRILTFNAARNIEHSIRNDLYEHLLRMSVAWFQRQSTGDLVSRVVNDVTQVRLLFGIGMLHIVNTAIAYVMVLGLMTSVSPSLTMYSLLPYPLILITMRFFTRAIYKRTQETQSQLSLLSARAQENLSGAAVVKAFGVQEEQIEGFAALSEDYLNSNLALARIRGAMNPYMGSISGLGMLIVLGFGGYATINQEITLGEYVEFSAYIVTLSWPTIAMGWVLSVWNRGTAAFDRIMEILSTEPTVKPAPDAKQLPAEARDIVFDEVCLNYEDGTQALHKISMEIRAGSRVAIVGRTGSGKSTLVHLIARLRDPTGGHIKIGQDDLRQIEPQSLRGYIGYVPQDPFLFSMSVRDNLKFGLTSGRVEGRVSLEHALKIAHLGDDIHAFHQGLDTIIGERGVTLSGGQKQRVTIARAVLLDPQLLILDDALSSVDTHTERMILEELDKLMEGRTSIMVTHRFNALEIFDDILVLDEGKLVERGTQRQLLELGGVYAEMHKRQMSEEDSV